MVTPLNVHPDFSQSVAQSELQRETVLKSLSKFSRAPLHMA